MKVDNYLSRLQFLISQAVAFFVFMILPLILKNTGGGDLKINTIRSLWEVNHVLLPIPTRYAIYFADNMHLRFFLFILFFTAGGMLELFSGNKMLSGTCHSVCLLVFITAGGLFLTACLLPFMPLK
ncbi:MAG: hypothetical protein JRI96_16840 [Deltaproteobacteria bacterium]|nr:hypothetical protein [Deltaproteobacteria bacterium]